MTSEPIEVVPKMGLRISLDAFREVDLQSGDRTLLSDVENRDNLLFSQDSLLKPYLAKFVRREADESVVFEAKSDDRRRTELLSRSVPLEFKRGVPNDVKSGLQEAYNELKAKVKQSGVTAEAREFIDSLRLADPQESPELYRVVKDQGKTKLFVIWGIVRHDGSEMFPIDAINRIPSHAQGRRIAAVAAGLLAAAALAALLFLLWPLWQTDDAVIAAEPVVVVTDRDEPPFLVVQPQAIFVGDTVSIIPCNVGVLRVSSHLGHEFLHREAKGVKDKETLKLFNPGVRKIDFEPSNPDFEPEAQGLIIYPRPTVRDQTVRASFPIGINLDRVEIDWGDGQRDLLTKGDRLWVEHDYAAPGRYVLNMQFPDNRAWASKSVDVTIP